MQPDVEALTCNYLRRRTDIAALVGLRVYTALPPDPQWPLITITRIGGGPDAWPYRLDQARLQIDCWADTKAQAHDLARTAQTALWAMPDVSHATGTVTHVAPDGPFLWLPDDTYPTPKPRYLFGVTVTVHP